MELDINQVKHLASLARIDLSEEEIQGLAKDLGDIFDLFESLRDLDIERVNPTAHIADVFNVTREDQIGDCLSTENVLSNAPRRDGDFFRVNAVLEE